jgi:hypothetical protein
VSWGGLDEQTAAPLLTKARVVACLDMTGEVGFYFLKFFEICF